MGPGQCGGRGVPAVQQGDHRCSGKWHPQGLSLACDRPRSVLAALSPLRVSEFVVSASARACAKGWCGGEWWHMVLCPAWMTCQHTHVHGRTDTVGCTHTRLFTFSATPVLGGTWGCHTRVSVCSGRVHTCVSVCAGRMHTCACTQATLHRHAHLPVCLCPGNTHGPAAAGMQTRTMHWEHA